MFLFAPCKGNAPLSSEILRRPSQDFILALGIALVRYSAVSGN